MSEKNKDELYYSQVIGVTRFFKWLSDLSNGEQKASSHKNIITLDDSISQRFGLALLRKQIRGKWYNVPSLVAQKPEVDWLNTIVWSKAIVRDKDRRLYLITKSVEANGTLSDMDAFAIAITVSDYKKLTVLFGDSILDKISCNHMWSDGEGIRINTKRSLFSIPIEFVDKDMPICLN